MTNTTTVSHASRAFPIVPTVPNDKPWMNAYERFGIDSTIEMPLADTSLLEIFDRNFGLFSKKNAFTCMDSTITYAQVDLYSKQIAAYLQSLGLVKGDKVCVMMPNVLQYPIVAVGVLRAGLTLVNANPMYTSRELEHQLKDSGSKVIFIIENFAKTFEDIEDKGDVEHVILCKVGDMLGAIKGSVINLAARYIKKMVPDYNLSSSISFKEVLNSVSAQKYVRPKLGLDDIALLQYTGGTTGVSKGAMLSHGNLIANTLQIRNLMDSGFDNEINAKEIILTALPLYHVFSFMICCMQGMYRGGEMLLIPNPRDIDGLIKEMIKRKPTFIPSVNTLFNALVSNSNFKKIDFSDLKCSIGGGMAVIPSVAKKWHDITGLPIVEGYGLSETSPVACINPVTISEYTGKIGIPAASTDIILITENGKETTTPLERGEICIKGPQVMVGYHNQPQETADSFTEHGYLKTGDIGHFETNGFLALVDRKKDMILVSGFNVYPNEIEAVMSEHPAVLECGAIGIPHNMRGEDPKLFVVTKDFVTEKELMDFAKTKLTGYKRPRYIQFVDELPKSTVGKILRKELRKMEGLE